MFPETTVQTCVVHLIRNSLAFSSWKDRKTIAPWIRAIYRAETEDPARARALANSPALLLLDKPLSALDAKVRVHLPTPLVRGRQVGRGHSLNITLPSHRLRVYPAPP